MKFTNAMQLKGWIKNKSKESGIHANEVLQNYIMERFLERLSLSPYRENMILKGGFLIAAMVGLDRRSTMDIDTTVKNLLISREKIEGIIREIIFIDIDDGVSFEIKDIKNIHEVGEYEDFRVSLLVTFQTLRVNLSIDITTGGSIIPYEVEYQYKLMFENRKIPVMAYNLNTILAEKIESILVRGVGNTRVRDFYDSYLLLSSNRDTLTRLELLNAIKIKAEERGSIPAFENYKKILIDIASSPDIALLWDNYKNRYHYARGIILSDVLSLIEWVFG